MKILQLIHKIQNRGAETFACQLSNHLIEKGHEVKIIALYPGGARLPFNGDIDVLDASNTKRFFDFFGWKKLAAFIKDFNPDIVQTNAGDTLKYAIFSKKIFWWKASIINRNASEVGRYLNSTLQKKLNTFFYKNVQGVISVSQASKKDLLQHFPFLADKICVIPVGLETVSQIKEIQLHPSDSKHIIHVGGFTFEKNHEGLLNIFQKILNTGEQVQLHLVGDGPLRQKIEKKVKQLKLTKYVSFHGFVNNPLEFIKAGDVLVLPSIIEGLPGVLLEAMYCKTPVIAYNVGGISEIVDSKTGFLIAKDDEDAFSKAILISLKTTDSEKKEVAYQMVKNNFMNFTLASQFLETYQEMR